MTPPRENHHKQFSLSSLAIKIHGPPAKPMLYRPSPPPWKSGALKMAHQEPHAFMVCASQQRHALTIRTAMVSDPTIFKFHIGVSQGPMLGDTPSHSHTPHTE
jgi:hypothetical protein